MTAAVAPASARQGMTLCGEGVLAAVANVAVGCRAGPSRIEGVGHPGFETEKLLHYRAPLAAMGTRPVAIAEMAYQPVGHLVGHYLDQIGVAVFPVEHRVEAQSAAAIMRLSGALATQVEPHPWPRQVGVKFATEPPGGLDPVEQGLLQRRLVEPGQPGRPGIRKYWPDRSSNGTLESSSGMVHGETKGFLVQTGSWSRFLARPAAHEKDRTRPGC